MIRKHISLWNRHFEDNFVDPASVMISFPYLISMLKSFNLSLFFILKGIRFLALKGNALGAMENCIHWSCYKKKIKSQVVRKFVFNFKKISY